MNVEAAAPAERFGGEKRRVAGVLRDAYAGLFEPLG
jgi:hypothetical protein